MIEEEQRRALMIKNEKNIDKQPVKFVEERPARETEQK
jgi:hypothetical protein